MASDGPDSTAARDGGDSSGHVDGNFDHDLEQRAWDLIIERIDALTAAWDQALARGGELPDIWEFAKDLDPQLAHFVMVELAKVDLERRWQCNRQPRHAEWYVERWPQLGSIDRLPASLIYEELQGRMHWGEAITPEEIRNRFPQQAAELIELLGGMSTAGSTTSRSFAGSDTEDAGDRVTQRSPRPSPIDELKPGSRIDDFELLAPLGSGAFARVFLARQTSMERIVALKVSEQVGAEPQTLAQLDHPHIVKVFDQRQVDQPPVRLLYMELAAGGTLFDALDRMRHAGDGRPTGPKFLEAIDHRLLAIGVPPPVSSASRRWIAAAQWPLIVCELGFQIAEGLQYAHLRGVMHRDIKPDNVLLTPDATPKLADFNVSYNVGRADEAPTDAFGGSLSYMAPEQLEACHPLLGGAPEDVREASDIYAVGVLLWELLVGKRPFRDDDVPSSGGPLVRMQRMIELRRRATSSELAQQLPKDCPEPLRQVLLRCLQPNPADRYETAAELARALQLCLYPRCWRLLEAPSSGLGRIALRWPVWTAILAGLIPNLLMAKFNSLHNRGWILREAPELFARFDRVERIVLVVAFSVGTAVAIRLALQVLWLLKRSDPDHAETACRRVLLFGAFVSLLLLILWTTAGILFPIAVDWGRQDLQPSGFYLHFFLSLALCGFAAAAYPYFLITFFAIRYYVPAMVRGGHVPGPLRSDLRLLGKLNRVHLLLSALVPMLGVLLAVVFGVAEDDWTLTVISGAGVLGFAAMFALERIIHRDMTALRHIAEGDTRVFEETF